MSDGQKPLGPVGRALVRHARRLEVRLYPELARLETESERDRTLAAVGIGHFRRWWYPGSVIVALAGGLAVGVLAAEGLQRVVVTGFVPGLLVRAVAVLGGLAVGGIVLGCLYRAQIRRELRRILAGRGVPICVTCGYDLTGNVSGRCPECGRAARSTCGDGR